MKTKMSSLWIGFAMLVVAMMLGGCGAGQLVKIPLTMPDGEKATLVAHNQTAPDWMIRSGAMKLNFVVRGDVSEKQLLAVARVEDACRIYTKTVRPNALVAVLSSGVLYAAAGYLGVGFGSQAFAGAVFSEYAKYGAMATGAAGLANGVISLGGKTYTFENCGSQVLGLFPGYDVRVLQKSPY
ncbi:MAG: hypothetical protein NTU85_01475 [Candidatus Kaiserbacteria bacterium]|nr:hypothetical protein [Candidatus Kaiserbacteria bacterium]